MHTWPGVGRHFSAETRESKSKDSIVYLMYTIFGREREREGVGTEMEGGKGTGKECGPRERERERLID